MIWKLIISVPFLITCCYLFLYFSFYMVDFFLKELGNINQLYVTHVIYEFFQEN